MGLPQWHFISELEMVMKDIKRVVKALKSPNGYLYEAQAMYKHLEKATKTLVEIRSDLEGHKKLETLEEITRYRQLRMKKRRERRKSS